MFTYKSIIVSAAQMAARYRYLWFFGFFAAFLSNSGVFQRIYTNDTAGILADWQRIKALGIFDLQNIRALGALIQNSPGQFLLNIVILLIVLALALCIVWLAVVSQGALIHGAASLYRNKKTSFQHDVRQGMAFFWPVFSFRFLEKAAMVLLLFGAGIVGSYALTAGGSLPGRIGAVLLFAAAFIAIAAVIFTARYAMSYAVIEGRRFIDALSGGLALLHGNILTTLEIGAIIFVLNIIVGFAVLMALSAAAIPFILLVILFYKLAFAAGLTFILVVGTAVLFVFLAGMGAILAVFNEALWTMFFLRLTAEKVPNHLSNLFGILTSKNT